MKKRLFVSLTLLTMLITACSNEDAFKNETVAKSGLCNIDTPTSGATVLADQKITVSGWAFDRAEVSIPEQVTVHFIGPDGRELYKVNASRGTQRPDVAQAFNHEGAVGSGFDAIIAEKSLLPGEYHLSISQTMVGKMIDCELEFKLVVK